MNGDQWDLFLSYASEDREEVAGPLAELLRAFGVSVWFDRFELSLGDSLRDKIDEGLVQSRFGVVVLSPSFFGKHFTGRELAGLAQKEVDGAKVILPVWHNIDEKEIRKYSPPLADRIGVRWGDGPPTVIGEILKSVRPDILGQLKAVHSGTPLPRIRTGAELASVIGGGHMGMFHNDDPEDERELDLVSTFLQELRDWADIWPDMEIGERIRTEYQLNERIQDIEEAGWSVFGNKEKRRQRVMGVLDDWVFSVVAVLRGEPVRVETVGDKLAVQRAPERHAR